MHFQHCDDWLVSQHSHGQSRSELVHFAIVVRGPDHCGAFARSPGLCHVTCISMVTSQ